MGDHPPITPTIKIPNNLQSEERKIYEYIVKHFLGSISPDAKFMNIQTTYKIGDYIFKSVGT